MTEEIIFFVDGDPVPQGSKTAVPINKGRTQWRVKDNAEKRLKPWRNDVAVACRRYMQGANIKMFAKDVPIYMETEFYFSRPKYHFHSDGTLREDAPKYKTSMPDRCKIQRGVEDALTGVLWHDDGAVVDGNCQKLYGPNPGVLIKVRALEQPRAIPLAEKVYDDNTRGKFACYRLTRTGNWQKLTGSYLTFGAAKEAAKALPGGNLCVSVWDLGRMIGYWSLTSVYPSKQAARVPTWCEAGPGWNNGIQP